jgi:hypothetical protein
MSVQSPSLARRSSRTLSGGLLVVLLACLPTSSAAAPIALDLTGSVGFTFCNVGPGCTVGWAFQVNSAIRVLDLGLFDRDSNGLGMDHAVGIFDGISQVLLTSTTVTNASTVVAATTPAGRWLLTPIVPLVLTPGVYIAVAFYEEQDLVDGLTVTAAFSTIPEITFLGGRADFQVPGLDFPETSLPTFDPGVFGPTFTAEAVPEPSVLLLLGAGAVALRRQRRRG